MGATAQGLLAQELTQQSCSEAAISRWLDWAAVPSSLLVALLYVGCSQHGFPRKSKDRWKPTVFCNLIPEETGHRLFYSTDLCWYTERVEHRVCTSGGRGRLAILEVPRRAGLSCKTIHSLIQLSVVEPDNTVTKPAPLGTCN